MRLLLLSCSDRLLPQSFKSGGLLLSGVFEGFHLCCILFGKDTRCFGLLCLLFSLGLGCQCHLFLLLCKRGARQHHFQIVLVL